MYSSKCVYYKQEPDSKNYYALIIKKTKDITCIISPGAH